MTRLEKSQSMRHLGRIAVVGAAAVTLAGAMPTTTEARPMHPANGEIQICMETGGDPYLFEYWGVWAVGCEYITVTTGTSDDVASEQITATRDRARATHAQHHQKHKHTSHTRKRR
jgi:hypothetical protein